MSTRERAVHRGRERGRDLVRSTGKEVRRARRELALTLQAVAREVGISVAELSRIERGLAPWVSVMVLAQVSAVVGLDLSVKVYPGERPIREAAHARSLAAFHALLDESLGWSVEVPLPQRGDRRAWDGIVRGPGWRYGVEVEINPIDGQALIRRLRLKQRDGMVDGVILVLRDTRQSRRFRREYADLLAADFPIPGRRAAAALAAARDPGGSAIIVM